MYRHIIRPILFEFNPETAHKISLACLGMLRKLPFGRALTRLFFRKDKPELSREVFGINFPNPVGLAGGLDKNGEYYNSLSDLGFGFVEIGSLTPKPQDGNAKPRLFRVVQDNAIINRMGINNKGVLAAIEQLKKDKPEVIVAANIAKNSTSEGEQVAGDYLYDFTMLYDFVDMFVVNVSCPNVEGLTGLQEITFLSEIMDGLLESRVGMEVYKPILLKISPDLGKNQIDEIISYSMRSGIDGIVAGNTTRSRDGLSISPAKVEAIGKGGMSGAPLYEKNLSLVKYVHEKSLGRLPIVGVGGVMSPRQAEEMLEAGASLIEVYTGFIYNGPGFVKKILKHLIKNKIEKA